MKRISIVIFSIALLLLKGLNGYTQNFTNQMIGTVEKDDSIALSKLLKDKNIDSCYEVYTVLSWAIKMKATKCLNWILKQGADVNKVCDNYKPPVFHAVKYGDLVLLKKLVAHGAKVDVTFEGVTLKEEAIKRKKEDIVSYLSK